MSTPMTWQSLLSDVIRDSDCPNCDDGCKAVYYCEGCDQVICTGCYREHNEDANCHICGMASDRDDDGDLTEEGCGC